MTEEVRIEHSSTNRVKAERGRNTAVVVGAERSVAQRLARKTLDGLYWSGGAWRGSYRSPSTVEGDDTTFVKAGDGWHSTMEPSEQSEQINALTRGDVPLPFPVIAVFMATSNVCSTGVTLYVPEGEESALQARLEQTQAAPAYAGVDG